VATAAPTRPPLEIISVCVVGLIRCSGRLRTPRSHVSQRSPQIERGGRAALLDAFSSILHDQGECLPTGGDASGSFCCSNSRSSKPFRPKVACHQPVRKTRSKGFDPRSPLHQPFRINSAPVIRAASRDRSTPNKVLMEGDREQRHRSEERQVPSRRRTPTLGHPIEA
jgi:hypothetical protein